MRSQNNCIGYFHSLFFPYQDNYEQLGISSLHTCTQTISTFNSLLRSEHVRKTFDKHETENNNNILGYMFVFFLSLFRHTRDHSVTKSSLLNGDFPIDDFHEQEGTAGDSGRSSRQEMFL